MKKAEIKAMRWTSTVGPVLLALLLISIPPDGHAVTTTATGSGNWGDAIWDFGVPAAGYDVVIPGGITVTNNAATADLASLTNNGTLVFSGWNSGLTATVVTVNGTITHGSNTDVTGSITNYSDWTPDNRVYIACSNLTISGSGSITVSGMGYTGCKTNNGSQGFPGFGPGGGPRTGSSSAQGAGYGGSGGQGRDGPGGLAYGSLTAPEDPGSGGASGYNGFGGNGGGAVKIVASGTVTINGTISADGVDSTSDHGGGGSGGSVYIACYLFAGTGGRITATGGSTSVLPTGPIGSGGGGGRIALYYNTTAQALQPQPTVVFQTQGGIANVGRGQSGTVYLPNTALLPQALTSLFKNVRLLGFSSWRPQSLTITNADVAFEETNFLLTVTNNISISGAGASLLISTNAIVNCLNLTLANAGILYLYSGMTDAVSTSYGALLSVTNDVNISNTGSWIYVYSHPTNGGSCLLRMNNLYINSMTTNHGINAVGSGFRGGRGAGNTGCGPGTTPVGANNTSGGAGYGGLGGDSLRSGANGTGFGGPAYGSPYAPLLPGSGGGSGYDKYIGGDGGGLVRIEATNKVVVNGTIDASGTYSGSIHSGGGSGGGIYIACQTFAGTGGLVRANGGNSGPVGDGGAGAGGRIAVLYNAGAQSALPIPTVRFQASAGSQHPYDFSYGLFRITKPMVGTLYLPNSTFLSGALSDYFSDIRFFGWSTWSASSLTLSNSFMGFDESGFILTVTNDVLLSGTGAGLELTNGLLMCRTLTLTNGAQVQGLNVACSGNLIVGTGCQFSAYAFVTNAVGTNYGALIDVAGSISIASNGWIIPISHPTNGASTLFRCAQWLTVAGGTNGGFNARGRGFQGGRVFTNTLAAGMGPGGGGAAIGGSASGGGYGGSGGRSRNVAAGGITYGSSNAPVQPGSGGGRCGGNYHGGDGGGLVRIEARRIALDGIIDARGTDVNYDHDGGGSGGGIYIICATIGGNGSLRADGGGFTGVNGGNGGGGRIAVRNWRGYNTFTGIASVTTNFTITPGYFPPMPELGTIVWAEYSSPGTVFVIH